MKTIRIYLTIIFLSAFSLNATAQEFEYIGANLFGIDILPSEENEITLNHFFYDRDNDGDMDLFHVGVVTDPTQLPSLDNMNFFLQYQENTGDANNPQFGAKEEAFSNFVFPDIFLAAPGDIDGDGDMDMVVNAAFDQPSGFQSTIIYINQGGEMETFDVMNVEETGLPKHYPNCILFPEFTDLDMDGDLDILLSGTRPEDLSFQNDIPHNLYAKNIGTPTDPEFIGWFNDPYNITNDDNVEFMKTGDLDLDGDMDILSIKQIDEENQIYFRENQPGSDQKPHFLEPVIAPFGLPQYSEGDVVLGPVLVDIDGDGDLDFFIMASEGEEGGFLYYRNTDCVPSTENISEDICEGESVIIGEMEFDVEGSYNVVLQNQDGCDSIINLDLSVHESKEVSISEDLCDGDVFAIGDQEFSSSGTYQVQLKTSFGCDSTVNAELTFHTLNLTVTQDEGTLIATAGQGTYQWYKCNGEIIPGATTPTYNPGAAGSYMVLIGDEFGCEAFSECIDVTETSLEELRIANQLILSPNPTSLYLKITNQSGYSIDDMRIYNQHGQLCKVQKIMDGTVDVTEFEPGLYLFELNLDKYRIIKKVIILDSN